MPEEGAVALMRFILWALAFASGRVVASTDSDAFNVMRPQAVGVLLGVFLRAIRRRSAGISGYFLFNFTGYIRVQLIAHKSGVVEGKAASREVLFDSGSDFAVSIQVLLDLFATHDSIGRSLDVLLPILA